LLRLVAGLIAVLAAGPAFAQFELPPDSKPDPAALFRGQCATCHSLSPADPPRQGPNLAGVIGRHAGRVAGFQFSPGFAKADFDWDAAHLDAYLTNPQSVVPGAIMPYRQANPATRQAIIGYLQEQK
jgi:cytochrome c